MVECHNGFEHGSNDIYASIFGDVPKPWCCFEKNNHHYFTKRPEKPTFSIHDCYTGNGQYPTYTHTKNSMYTWKLSCCYANIEFSRDFTWWFEGNAMKSPDVTFMLLKDLKWHDPSDLLSGDPSSNHRSFRYTQNEATYPYSRLFWYGGFSLKPYPLTLYRWGFLHFRCLKCLVIQVYTSNTSPLGCPRKLANGL